MPGIGQSGGIPSPHDDSLGVIISLPPALAAELSAWRAKYGGPEAAVVPPHITLVSGRASESWEEAAAHVRAVAASGKPFRLSLRGTGSFAPLSSVVFLNVVQGNSECEQLHRQLVAGPVDHLLEFAFHPHLTVAHDLDEESMARALEEMVDFEADFDVSSIGLFDYLSGVWALREELPLGGSHQG